MSEDLIRYDILAQDALRGVVKTVLTEVARTGLPGEHHFYITFNTQAAGVRISPRLVEKYPQEMTIVLQHQFWDLEAFEQAIEIGLSFDGIPEKLFIPYTAITTFIDPSVHFSLQFEVESETDDVLDDFEMDESDADAVLTVMTPKAVEDISSEAEDKGTDDAEAEPAATNEDADGDTGSEDDKKEEQPGSAEVVSLDAFRKK